MRANQCSRERNRSRCFDRDPASLASFSASATTLKSWRLARGVIGRISRIGRDGVLYRARHPFPVEEAAFPFQPGRLTGVHDYSSSEWHAPRAPSSSAFLLFSVEKNDERKRAILSSPRHRRNRIGNDAIDPIFPGTRAVREAILTQNQSTTPGVKDGVRRGGVV